eukprot:TRINITY_DN12247_c0_g1_i1.p1 TRINITY_DN12247_c0_g1~~TRINITY_DN12247_c0_g1_i1.p1  ORF type:complete len:215 (+),score=33.83 TRINITY_DN12247_c0_g1_i1:30-674(+)
MYSKRRKLNNYDEDLYAPELHNTDPIAPELEVNLDAGNGNITIEDPDGEFQENIRRAVDDLMGDAEEEVVVPQGRGMESPSLHRRVSGNTLNELVFAAEADYAPAANAAPPESVENAKRARWKAKWKELSEFMLPSEKMSAAEWLLLQFAAAEHSSVRQFDMRHVYRIRWRTLLGRTVRHYCGAALLGVHDKYCQPPSMRRSIMSSHLPGWSPR